MSQESLESKDKQDKSKNNTGFIAGGLLMRFFIFWSCLLAVYLMSSLLLVRSSFNAYLERSDLHRVSRIAHRLEDLYGRAGSWSFVKNNPQNVEEEIKNSMGPGAHGPREQGFAPGQPPEMVPPPDMGSEQDMGPPPDGAPPPDMGFGPRGGHPPLPPEILDLIARVNVFDGQGQRVWGVAEVSPQKPGIVLTSGGQKIGNLVLTSEKAPDGDSTDTFFQEVRGNLTLLTIVVLILSGVLTGSTQRRMRLRLSGLLSGLTALTDGHNEKRLKTGFQDEVGELESQYNKLADVLVAQDRGHRQWVADTSHELRTPIAVLRAQVEAFQDGVQEVTPRNLAVLHNEIMALSKLVDDLHWLAKYDVGQIKNIPVMTDIGATLQDVIEGLDERFESKGLKVNSTVSGGGRYLANLDTGRLRQVFANLLENSLRYTDKGGAVHVSAEIDSSGERLIMRFDDSAPGVSDEVLDKMFERFFRAETSRSRTLGGSGLGLAICKNNMQMLGGTIEGFHSPLGGVRMQLNLPLETKREEHE